MRSGTPTKVLRTVPLRRGTAFPAPVPGERVTVDKEWGFQYRHGAWLAAVSPRRPVSSPPLLLKAPPR
jgi:hypothetical protein